MKKLIAICTFSLFVGLTASGQTVNRVKTPLKKTTKAKIINSLRSPSTQAKLQKAKQEMRKEGE